MQPTMGVIGLMEHQRAVRSFRPDAVEPSRLRQVLAAATRAPSAQNAQPWRFVVVGDDRLKAQLGDLFDHRGERLYGAPGSGDDRTPWADVPVVVVVCSEPPRGAGSPPSNGSDGASVYPAIQNMLLAAQSLGLAGYMTTRLRRDEPAVRKIFEIPDPVRLHAVVLLGWPTEPPRPNRRRPVEEVTFCNRYGHPLPPGA